MQTIQQSRLLLSTLLLGCVKVTTVSYTSWQTYCKLMTLTGTSVITVTVTVDVCSAIHAPLAASQQCISCEMAILTFKVHINSTLAYLSQWWWWCQGHKCQGHGQELECQGQGLDYHGQGLFFYCIDYCIARPIRFVVGLALNTYDDDDDDDDKSVLKAPQGQGHVLEDSITDLSLILPLQSILFLATNRLSTVLWINGHVDLHFDYFSSGPPFGY